MLWLCYRRGCVSILRSGLYFQEILRPALSHVYFQRAMPLLREYADANRGKRALSPDFAERMSDCPLTGRDLLHMEYAICLGFADLRAKSGGPGLAVMGWPGSGGGTDAALAENAAAAAAGVDVPGGGPREHRGPPDDLLADDDESKPPFDL